MKRLPNIENISDAQDAISQLNTRLDELEKRLRQTTRMTAATLDLPALDNLTSIDSLPASKNKHQKTHKGKKSNPHHPKTKIKTKHSTALFDPGTQDDVADGTHATRVDNNGAQVLGLNAFQTIGTLTIAAFSATSIIDFTAAVLFAATGISATNDEIDLQIFDATSSVVVWSNMQNKLNYSGGGTVSPPFFSMSSPHISYIAGDTLTHTYNLQVQIVTGGAPTGTVNRVLFNASRDPA